jgi:hypothetical protein
MATDDVGSARLLGQESPDCAEEGAAKRQKGLGGFAEDRVGVTDRDERATVDGVRAGEETSGLVAADGIVRINERSPIDRDDVERGQRTGERVAARGEAITE